MLGICVSFKRKLQCKPEAKQVHEPKTSWQQNGNTTANNEKTKSGLLEYSNIIQGSKRYLKKSLSLNPKSEGMMIDISDPINHEILDDDSDLEGCYRSITRASSTSSRLSNRVYYNEENVLSNTRSLVHMDGPSMLKCYNYGDKLNSHNTVEAHHITEHSVTEIEEESSRQIVETICGRGRSLVSSELWEIDCMLKVHNKPKTLACFDKCREMVKIKANTSKNHPRCLADGNELLMFHGTNIACSLGTNSCYSLCNLDYCGVCQILRNGFSANKEFQGVSGVFTSSTRGKALDSVMIFDESECTRKSVIVCRVIAGRVHYHFEEIHEDFESKFDSLAKKVSDHSDIEELYSLNPKALLPCFVVIYKQQTVNI